MSAVGDTLADRYQLRASCGGGGLGEVFVARDLRSGCDLAVKVFDAAPILVEDLTRLTALLTAATRVEHPAVTLPRIQLGTSESPPFLAGEHIAGEDLADLALRLGVVPWQLALDIAHACAHGLLALTAATGVAHRALKPGNIRITPDNEVRILDFGVAELGVQPVPPRQDGLVAEYRAPEQLAGAPGDASSDIYTLGVLLFELTTGVHPFTGPTAFKAARSVQSRRFAPRPSEFAAATLLPSQVEALIARALAPQPWERFHDLDELARHLARIRPSPSPTPRAPSPAPHSPAPIEDNLEDRTTLVSLPPNPDLRQAPIDRTIPDRPDRTEVLSEGPPAVEATLILSSSIQRPERPALPTFEPRRPAPSTVPTLDGDRTMILAPQARPSPAPALPAPPPGLFWPALMCAISLGLALVALLMFAE